MKSKIMTMAIYVVIVTSIFIMLTPTAMSQYISMDLSTWNAESYDPVSGFPTALWIVSGDNASVQEANNGQPTLFYSDISTISNGKININVPSGGGDDDYIGFILGFNPGDTSNPNADYLLVDWKRSTQWYDFLGNDSCGPGTTAPAGLAVSRISGVPTADEFWGHIDQDVVCSPAGNGVTELARAANLGNSGWSHNTDYLFEFEFTETSLKVYVNSALEIDIAGTFNDGGRIAFYDFSQAQATYGAFCLDADDDGICDEDEIPVPEPFLAIAAITALAPALAYGIVRRRRK